VELSFQSKSLPNVIADAPQDDLLDSFSLQIVLDMLAVMTTVEELTQLESLTPEQKKQVWVATPEEVKLRLKQIRAGVPVEPRVVEPSVEPRWVEKEEDPEEAVEALEVEPKELQELEEGLGNLSEIPAEGRSTDESSENEKSEEESLEEMGEAISSRYPQEDDYNTLSENSLFDLPLFQSPYDLGEAITPPHFELGDRVVLRAEPRLSAAELIAVWEVVAVQGEQARIEAKGLGSRQYPLTWMVAYPEEEPEF
jgi:hypothetical protein